MLLTIAHNPHSEKPEELFEAIQIEMGESYLHTVEPDREGLKNLQHLISPNMAK